MSKLFTLLMYLSSLAAISVVGKTVSCRFSFSNEKSMVDVVEENLMFLRDHMKYKVVSQPERDYLLIAGAMRFKSSNRIHPLHRLKVGDLYSSMGMDDLENEFLDYEIAIDSEEVSESYSKKYLYTVEIRGQTVQKIFKNLSELLKKSLLRRAAINIAKGLIYFGEYKDVEFLDVNEVQR